MYIPFEEIKNNNNLMLNLKNDIIFKNCFLDYNCKPYLIKLINLLFNLNYKNIIIKNNEIASGKIKDKSSFTDLICSNGNVDFIIEMNNYKGNSILEKNMGYLFRQHIRKINKKDNYGRNKYTYLINIDNFDAVEKNDLVYESFINFPKYNITLYKNIKVMHINLAKLRKIIKCREIEGVIKIMDRMKMENDYIATYDREEFERLVKEEFETDLIKFNTDKEKFNTDKEKFNTDKEKFNIDKEKFNEEKQGIVKEFKKMGLSLKKISELTKLSIDEIKILL